MSAGERAKEQADHGRGPYLTEPQSDAFLHDVAGLTKIDRRTEAYIKRCKERYRAREQTAGKAGSEHRVVACKEARPERPQQRSEEQRHEHHSAGNAVQPSFHRTIRYPVKRPLNRAWGRRRAETNPPEGPLAERAGARQAARLQYRRELVSTDVGFLCLHESHSALLCSAIACIAREPRLHRPRVGGPGAGTRQSSLSSRASSPDLSSSLSLALPLSGRSTAGDARYTGVGGDESSSCASDVHDQRRILLAYRAPCDPRVHVSRLGGRTAATWQRRQHTGCPAES